MKTEDIQKICKQVRNAYPTYLVRVTDNNLYNVVESVLELARVNALQADPIMAVYAEGLDRDYLLGFSTGDQKDIAAFYDNKKQFGLKLVPIAVKAIPTGFADRKADLVTKRDELQKQLDDLNKQIKSV